MQTDQQTLAPTRYYSKKGPYFFAKCPKDYDASSDPETFEREWTFGTNSGSTTGWKTDRIFGLIESAVISNPPFAEDEDHLRIYIQRHEIDHLQCLDIELYEGDTLSVVQTLAAINLNQEVEFTLAEGKPYQISLPGGQKKTITPHNIVVSQNGKRLKWRWPWNKDEKRFDGLPKPEYEEKMGKKVLNTDLRDEAYYQEIKDFMDRCEIECSGVRESRPKTPGEERYEAENGSNVPAEAADCPF